MFPGPKELVLIGYSIESIWTKNPSQIHWHQEPTRGHANQGKFHMWRMESSFVFVSTLAISVLPDCLWSDAKKNARRIRWRKSHSEVKADDEL